jgi:hypothetical protein
MSSGAPLDPLPDDLARLWQAERTRPAPCARSAHRVWSGVASQVGIMPAPGGPQDGGSSSTPSSATPPAPVSPQGVGAATAAGMLSHPLASGALGFVLGGIVGGATVASLLPHGSLPGSAPATSVSAALSWSAPSALPDAPSAAASVVEIESLPTASNTTVAVEPTVRSADAGATTAVRDTDLNTERSLLDEARTSLMRGRGPAAINALQRHAQQYPRGKLSQEREALFIQALASTGQTDQARARAALFRKQFPTSLLLPAVEAAVQ